MYSALPKTVLNGRRCGLELQKWLYAFIGIGQFKLVSRQCCGSVGIAVHCGT